MHIMFLKACASLLFRNETNDSFFGIHHVSAFPYQNSVNSLQVEYDHNFTCDVCGKIFVCRSHLQGHMINHTEERPYSCEVCDKKYKRQSHLRRHILVHKRLCNTCNHFFMWPDEFKEHKAKCGEEIFTNI